jgi:ankyrin repeat protein
LIGNSSILKYFLKDGALLDICDAEGRMPIDVAIANGHVVGEESCAAQLLKYGSPLKEDMWHKLLILALDKDIVIYPKIAFDRDIYLHNVDDDAKFSFHKAVCCNSKQIIKYLGDVFGKQTMRRVGLTPDIRGLTAPEYAKISDDEELIKLVSTVMGDDILKENKSTMPPAPPIKHLD